MKKILMFFEKFIFLPSRKINSLEEKKKRLDFLVYFFEVFFTIMIFAIYIYSSNIIIESQTTNNDKIILSFCMVAVTLYFFYKHIMYMNEIRNLVEKHTEKIKRIEREEL